jgi:FkbM family methyltransferase
MNKFVEGLKSIAFRSEFVTSALRQLRLLLHMLRRTPHEKDFNFLADPRFRNGLLIDLGANIGQSAISALKVQPTLKILSIEANPACESPLRLAKRLLGERFSFRLVGVGAYETSLSVFVPLRSSRLLLEEGTFDREILRTAATMRRIGSEGVDYQVQQIEIPVISVDSLECTPVAIKMDLQGFELTALQGMVRTIERSRPFIMIENGEDLERIALFLDAFGYELTVWDGSSLRKAKSTQGCLNVIFSPMGEDALVSLVASS